MSSDSFLSRRRFGTLLLSSTASLLAGCPQRSGSSDDAVKVGVLHALSGTMAIIAKPVAEMTMFAIEEINAQGGLLGRKLVPLLVDGRSDPAVFAREAERLIVDEHVKVVFGLLNSASRRTTKSVFEKYNHLLFYPMSYEGLEQSPNIIYTGAAPNQQITPAVKWCFDNLGKRFFLVGTDQVHSRAANAMIQDQVSALDGEVVGEAYVLWGSKDVTSVIEQIETRKPSVIVNSITGDSNLAFFRELRRAGITPTKIPTLSFALTEHELAALNTREMAGDYVAWNYLQAQSNPENIEFVKRVRARFGANSVVDDPMESGYLSVYLWAAAVRAARSFSPDLVLGTLPNQSYNAPEGLVYVDAENNHVWRSARIGKIDTDGSFDLVWESGRALRPVPYPIYRTKADWETLLNDLFIGWKRQWMNRG